MGLPIKPANSHFNDQQWQAIYQKGDNLLVAASAGSGKTSVLIERILQHLNSTYAEIDQLLVVTFTEAAALEMKERMDKKLQQAIQTSSGSHLTYLLGQRDKLSQAHIRTLHAFCLQVIQRFFYLSDINPDFRLITSSAELELIYLRAWQRVVEQIHQEDSDQLLKPVDFQRLLDCYSSSRDSQGLLDLVKAIYQFALAHPQPMVWLKEACHGFNSLEEFFDSELYANGLEVTLKAGCQLALHSYEHIESILMSCSQTCIDKYQSLLQNEAQAIRTIYQALLEKSPQKIFQSLDQLSFDRWPSSRGKQLEEDLEWIQEMKELRDQAKKQLNNLQKLFPYDLAQSKSIEIKIQVDLQRLGQLCQAFYEQIQWIKKQEALMDYNDLEHVTLDLLAPYDPNTQSRQASPAAHYYQAQFKEVMVDEYQDINEIQSEILAWLSHEYVPNQKGNLFMVGDVKQSIYGFRMAEPSLFLAKYLAYQDNQGGQLIQLDRNYRSRFEVLNFTNYLFERLMDHKFGQMDYGLAESLKLGRNDFDYSGPDSPYQIEILLYNKEGLEEAEEAEDLDSDASGLFDASIQAEALMIAQDIHNKIRSGYQIYDKDRGQDRQITFRDIVVLCPTKASFLPLHEAMNYYGLPFMSQDLEAYFQRQEIQLMLALLKLLDNPIQDIPWVAILRSYFVGLDDNDLSRIRLAHPNGSYYEALVHYLYQIEPTHQYYSSELQKRIKAFYQQLLSWMDYQNNHRLDELIWLIYQDTGFLDFVMGLDHGPKRQANLHAFYQLGQTLAQQGKQTLTAFIQYIDKMLDHEKDLAEPLLIEENQNQIQAMTIHASKGKEYPIVYLMNLSRKFNQQDLRRPVCLTKNFGMGIDYYESDQRLIYQSLSKVAQQQVLEQNAKSEELRKLYVALTRAEQKIILVGTINKEEEWENWQDQVVKAKDPESVLVDLASRSQAKHFLRWIASALALYRANTQGNAKLQEGDFKVSIKNQSQVQEQLPTINAWSTLKDPNLWLQENWEPLVNRQPDSSINLARLNQQLFYDYPYIHSSQTSSYQSVSELKRLFEEPDHPHISHFEDRRPGIVDQGVQSLPFMQDAFLAPEFMQEDRMTASRIGSLNHFFMQKIDFSEFQARSIQQYPSVLNQQANRLLNQGYLTKQEIGHLAVDSISHFLASSLGQEMIDNAANIQKERPYSYWVKASELFQNLPQASLKFAEDHVLIHGVIDAYWLRSNEGFVLIDYKTDRFHPSAHLSKEEQLARLKLKYQTQLSLYAQALKNALNMEAAGIYLVALDFNQVISMTE